MEKWSLVLTLAALLGALLAVVLVGRRYEALRAALLLLKEKSEKASHQALDLAGRVHTMEGELRAARIQAARIPLLLDQIKDRDGEIERLQSRSRKVVYLPRGASKPGDSGDPADEWYHDVLVFPPDQPPPETGAAAPPPDTGNETDPAR
jgi:hypothetical protein